MTTNGKGVTKERLFAFVKETTALGKECGIVEKEGRQDQGQHRQHLSATRQVSAGPVQQNPGPPAQNTEKTENKSPATRSRGLFFLENRTEPKHYRRP